MGSTVLAGPFEGLRYPGEWISLEADAPIAKLTGLYERELTPIIERVIADPPPVIVDIGAADGYYAVGLALKCPGSRVIAFEAASSGRAMCERLARANHVRWPSAARLRVDDCNAFRWTAPSCSVMWRGPRLRSSAPGPRMLRTATVLVELYEHLIAGVADLLKERFSVTHECMIVPAEERDPALAEPYGLVGEDAALAVNEWRPAGMSWALFTPR